VTVADLIAEVRALCAYDLDLYHTVAGGGVPATDDQIVLSLNKAQQRIGLIAKCYSPVIALTLSSSTFGIYDLRDPTIAANPVIDVEDVIINGVMLRNRAVTSYGPWSVTELEQDYPGWRTDAVGTPTKFALLREAQIVLHPNPDPATIANNGQHFVKGTYLPADFSASNQTAVPDLPLELHEWIAKLAAAIEAGPVVTEQSQMVKVQSWINGAVGTDKNNPGAAQMVGRRNEDSMAAWGSTSGDSVPKFMRAF
jgi:hypothetical protein